MKVCAIILAAGFSKRMGQFKPLLRLERWSALECCVQSFRSAGINDIFVVSGHRHEEVSLVCRRLQVNHVYNPEYPQGMMSSVQAGVKSLPAGLEAFFILPVDIPLVRPWTINTTYKKFQIHNPIVAYPSFKGKRGHPPLISIQIRSTILKGGFENGLRGVLQQFENRALNVPTFDRNILLDMDNPDDVAEMGKRAQKLSRLDSQEAWELIRHVYPISEKGLSHGLAVGKTARALAHSLSHAGSCDLDPELAYTCGLIHDLAKGKPQHEKAGGELLYKMGLDEMAPIVAGHRDAYQGPNAALGVKEIVYLADKMNRGDKPVRIRDRFQEKLDLYAHDPEAVAAISQRLENALAVKEKIDRILGYSLEEAINPMG